MEARAERVVGVWVCSVSTVARCVTAAQRRVFVERVHAPRVFQERESFVRGGGCCGFPCCRLPPSHAIACLLIHAQLTNICTLRCTPRGGVWSGAASLFKRALPGLAALRGACAHTCI